MRNKLLKITAVSLMMALTVTNTAMASTDVNRSAEEWARLKDNVLEFDEIDGLIHEYNATVKNNYYSAQDFKKKYGKTNSEIRDAYLDLANDLLAQCDYSSDSAALASVQTESLAKTAQSNADESLEDYEQYQLTYEQTEVGLAQSAKLKMIDYYNAVLDEQKAQLNLDLLTSQLNVLNVKQRVGMTTATEVLTTQESVLNAQQTLVTAGTTKTTTKKKLQVLCGWKYEDDAELAALPEFDVNRVVDPAADLEKAIGNNYALKINERKLTYAQSQTTKDSLNNTINSNKQTVAMNLNNYAASIDAAKKAYTYAAANADLQNKTLANIQAKAKAGTVSTVELETQQKQTAIANIDLQKAKNSLLAAYVTYDYAVAGLG